MKKHSLYVFDIFKEENYYKNRKGRRQKHLFEEDLKPVFEKAMECGLNLWDTAAVYGEGTSERILGNFVKDVNREDVILFTKFTPQIAGNLPDAMQERK